MKTVFKPILFAVIFATAATLGGQSFAQSTQNMKYLSEEERADFTRRLQKAGISSERTKITAEMNQAIQKHRMEQRQMERAKKEATAPKK
jgi:hypothetical protein